MYFPTPGRVQELRLLDGRVKEESHWGPLNGGITERTGLVTDFNDGTKRTGEGKPNFSDMRRKWTGKEYARAENGYGKGFIGLLCTDNLIFQTYRAVSSQAGDLSEMKACSEVLVRRARP